MQKILWPGIQIDVLLDTSCSCLFARFGWTPIHYSENESLRVVSELHSDREPDIENHWSYNSVSLTCEPVSIEISIVSVKNTKNSPLTFKICIAKHNQETSVEEDANEHRVCDVSHLVRFCLASNHGDDFYDDHSDCHVYKNNEVWKELVHSNNFPSQNLVVLTNWIFPKSIFDFRAICEVFCVLAFRNPT